jgi:uncharacterized protein
MKFKKTNIPFSYLLDTKAKGPTVTIIGGIHGNETCGVETFYWLKEKFPLNNKIDCGKLYIILGNPKAAELGQRYFEEDLNRQFDTKSNSFKLSYEGLRAKEIKTILKKTDFLLDIHSTSSPSTPMSCSEGKNKDMKIAATLGVKYITTNWDGKLKEGCAADEWMAKIGKIGITIECGSHKSHTSTPFAKQTAIRFLNAIGMIDTKAKPLLKKPKVIKITENIYPTHDSFQFTKNFKSFDPIPKGSVYAIENGKKLKAKENYLIIMPNKNIQIGVDAGFLGKITNQLYS